MNKRQAVYPYSTRALPCSIPIQDTMSSGVSGSSPTTARALASAARETR